MLYEAYGGKLQVAELLHEVIETEAFISLDLVEHGGRPPVDIDGANGLGLLPRGVGEPVVRPNIYSSERASYRPPFSTSCSWAQRKSASSSC